MIRFARLQISSVAASLLRRLTIPYRYFGREGQMSTKTDKPFANDIGGPLPIMLQHYSQAFLP